MAKIISVLNFCVIVGVMVTATFWASSPATPKPLPNDAHFVSQVQQPGTVVVKFGAEWCQPCRMIEKELDALSASSSDVSVVKINFDQNRALAAHYQVSSIPCLLLFHDGKQVGKTTGYRTRDQLKNWVATAR